MSEIIACTLEEALAQPRKFTVIVTREMLERLRDLALSQAETIRLQGEEIEKLNRLLSHEINMVQNEYERGYVRAMADSKYREDAALELVAKTEQERDELRDRWIASFGYDPLKSEPNPTEGK